MAASRDRSGLPRHVGRALPQHVHHVLRHAGTQLPFELLQVTGDGAERADLLVQQVLLLRQLQQHGLGTLAHLVGEFTLALLQRVVLVERGHPEPQVPLEEDVGIVGRDHIAVLADQAVGQPRAGNRRADRQHPVDRLGGLVDEAHLGRVVGDRGACGDLVGDRPHHGLDPGREGRVRVARVQRDDIAVRVAVAAQQVLGDVRAGRCRLAVEQLADRGDRRRDGFRVAVRALGVEDDRADDAHDQLAFGVVQRRAGALQSLPGEVADKRRPVAHIGIGGAARRGQDAWPVAGATAPRRVAVAFQPHLDGQVGAGLVRAVARGLGRRADDGLGGFAGVDARVVDPGLQALRPLGQAAQQRRDRLQRELEGDAGQRGRDVAQHVLELLGRDVRERTAEDVDAAAAGLGAGELDRRELVHLVR
mmetsp:Transcript_41624/g.97857  ORF Transcript_41624/g.97857 Transcript_41624/m.97857 type:complete len:420 (-) Transcript_41624:322-1581(-)